MNCNDAAALIAAYADGETSLLQTHSIRRHLQGCAACAAKLEALTTLRTRIRAEAPRHSAPPALRARVLATADALSQASATRRRADGARWRWIGGGALVGSAATVLAWFLGTAIIEARVNEDVAVEAVTSHVRATLGNHLIQVASSNQHTVKPWLSARLDFAPPVKDLAAEGFALAGARLDFLDHRPVAALVYRYRDHVIDVYVRPQSSSAVAASRSVRGFNVVHAAGLGMDWFAVSDANAEALGQLVDKPSRDAAVP